MREDDPPQQLVSAVNLSMSACAIMSSGRASYIDLQEKLSVRDMYNILEAIMVENYNQRVWHKHQAAK
jgi:hypothetical protein